MNNKVVKYGMKCFSIRGQSFVHTRVCGRERGNCLTAWILHAAPGSVWSPPPGSWRLGPGPGYSGRPSQRSTRPMVLSRTTTPPPQLQHPPQGSSANIVNIYVHRCKNWRTVPINEQSSKGLSKESQLWTYWCSRKIPSIY